MAVSEVLVTKVGAGGKVEFVLPDAKEGDLVRLTVASVDVKHPERFGWAPGTVLSIGPDFDKPYDME